MHGRRFWTFTRLVLTAAVLSGGIFLVRGQNGNGNGKGKPPAKMRGTTPAQRKAARLHAAPQKKGVAKTFAGVNKATAKYSPLTTGLTTLATMAPSSPTDYFGVANWANSPLPQLDPLTGALLANTGMHKFVNTLPGICGVSPWGNAGANELGQCIPLAVPDTASFPGSDYYEISLVEYNEQMHSDLPGPLNTSNPGPGTKLRGYKQTNGLLGPAQPPHYLGPLIVARGCDPHIPTCVPRPVRVKFANMLPAGTGGDLFIPADTTYMGAGMGPGGAPYTQNRGNMHLHGGNTPWISDGTPHQWTVGASDTGAAYQKGLSTRYVPDMWFNGGTLIPACAGQATCAVPGATNNPGAGSMTFYWTNQQSGRLMFYHDHAYGITRLNVYAGEAAGYLISDTAVEDALANATVPGTNGTAADLLHLVPLVIQDKTFVPDNGAAGGQLAATDPTWNLAKYGGFGNLWFPHVYMPNQNPADNTGANPYGRWDYGPWFWPPQNSSTYVPSGQPYACTSSATPAAGWDFPPLMCPGTPTPSGAPEGFMDTPVVNGTAYPKMTVDPAAYRFQILVAGNDRTINLGLYVAEPLSVGLTNPGAGYTSAPVVTISGGTGGGTGAAAAALISTGSVSAVVLTGVGSGYTITPNVTITGNGTSATATAVIDPTVGQVTAVNVTNIGTGYSFANVAIDPPAGCLSGCVTATATATLSQAGSILAIQVTNPGSAPWTAAPVIGIGAPPAGGVQAQAFATVNTEVKMVDAAPRTASSVLQLCSAATATSGAMLALATLDSSGNPVNGTGLPANCWPTTWPTDGRDGGVPDPITAGPPIIQIGTEGGLLPSPVVIPSTPTGYEYNRRSITVLNIFTHGLLLGPAERADVIVDFSKFPGKTLILYNDAPAPVPAFDPRSDYYTGSADQSISGGAPSTLPGFGPNTRTIMQIQVNATVLGVPNIKPFSPLAVQTALPGIFALTQDKIIVPEAAFPAANGGGPNTYARIQDTTIKAFIGGPIGAVTLTSGGAGYTAAPTVNFLNGGGTGAAATANLAPISVGSVALTNGGSGYTSAPTVALTGGGGTGATATATLATRPVSSVKVTNQGNGYTGVPTVTFSAPQTAGGTTATGTAVVVSRKVTAITITNAGTGYTAAPTVTITGGGGSNAAATATLAPAAVASVALTNGGSGYTSAPLVAFSGGGGTGAAAAAALTPTVVASLTVTNGGTGYTSAPTVSFTAPQTAGTTATATVAAPVTPLLPKTIQELFTLDYGRMNATLGVELPFTNFLTQTTIPYGYVDPPTEIFKDGETQIWKITHNGVDTHFIHFHLFNVQVLNRVGWDGAIKPPDANEVSFKDTVRMNPLEDIIVALRPLKQNLPWDLPNSIRPLDVTAAVGTSIPNEFTDVDPTNQPAAVTNDLTNFGWEYVWHCHILGHEENDMMRAMVLAVPPKDPGALGVVLTGSGNNQAAVLTWTDNSLNETGFTIQRAPSSNGPWTTVTTVPGVPGSGTPVTYTDHTVARRTTYYYRVAAINLVGYTKTYAAPAAGYPNTTASSNPVNGPSVTTQ